MPLPDWGDHFGSPQTSGIELKSLSAHKRGAPIRSFIRSTIDVCRTSYKGPVFPRFLAVRS
jgi:hypothetical protein